MELNKRKYVIVTKDATREFLTEDDYLSDNIHKAIMFDSFTHAEKYRTKCLDEPDLFFVTKVDIHYEF